MTANDRKPSIVETAIVALVLATALVSFVAMATSNTTPQAQSVPAKK